MHRAPAIAPADDVPLEEAQTVIRPAGSTTPADKSAPPAPVPDRPSDASDVAATIPQTPAELTRRLQGRSLNHFRLIDQIGGGGMGAVFRARDEQLGREVAVKVVPFAGGDPDLQRRFRNEAQSAARLDHPLIARVFEVGSDGPWHYIVFEYVDGHNVREMVQRDGPISIDDAVYFTSQLAEAIGHASRRGIVHRDIKPSNVIVTQDGSIKLVDMGLARSENFDTSDDLTASGVTLGTFDYISPEQAHDPRAADFRSDVYSLGCTLYFMLTGSPPFPGGTMLQKLLSHGNAAVPDVRDQCDRASSDLAAVIKKMLAKQPDQRYQSSDALISDLRELASRENLVRSRGVVAPSGDEHRNFLWRRLSRHLPWIVAASLMLISVAWLELMAWQTRRDFNRQVAESRSPDATESLIVMPTSQPEPTASPELALSTSERRSAPSNGGAEPLLPATVDSMARIDATASDSLDSRLPVGPASVSASSLPVSDAISMSEERDLDVNTESDPSRMGEPDDEVDAGAALADRTEREMELDEVARVDAIDALNAAQPPSMQGFPFPVDSTASDPLGGFPSVLLGDPTADEIPAMRSIQERASDTSVNSSAAAVPAPLPQRIRIVDPKDAVDEAFKTAAESAGTMLSTSLLEALQAAETFDLNRLEIAIPRLISEPLVIQRNNLLIESIVPGGSVIVFRSNAENDMRRSDMMAIGSNQIECSNLHFYWPVPATETDGGSLFLLNENRQVRLSKCTVTIDNPSRRDLIHVFHVETPATVAELTMLSNGGFRDPDSDALPLVSIELENVVIRGQAGVVNMQPAAELQLRWENGLLAISRPMINTAGSIARPRPTSGAIRLSFVELTALIPEGLIRMQLDSFTPFPVAMERSAERSVFVVQPEIPYVEMIGLGRDQRETSWLSLSGSANAYETDSTLSAPLLLVRDLFGQTQLTTMSDLLPENALPWADDKTPRWRVRWSQPLPTDTPASRLAPADFRQDGSLVGGFDERRLPRLPPQSEFDFSLAE
ncbi:MAG: serine/threonine-protein kinase [Planctomycetota bacterium]